MHLLIFVWWHSIYFGGPVLDCGLLFYVVIFWVTIDSDLESCKTPLILGGETIKQQKLGQILCKF